MERASREERKKEKKNRWTVLYYSKTTTGEANIICAKIKLICVAIDIGRYYPVHLLVYKASETLLKEFLYKYQAVTLISEN